MSQRLYLLGQTNVSKDSPAVFSFRVEQDFALIRITANSIDTGIDPDIYIGNGYTPTTYSYDYWSSAIGADEVLNISNLPQGTYTGIVSPFSGSGRIAIAVDGYFLAELGASNPIDDTENTVGGDIISIGDDTNAKLGAVYLTINQDTSAIATTLSNLDKTITDAITKSIDSLADKIVSGIKSTSDISSTHLTGVTNSLEQSYKIIGTEIGTDLTELGTKLDNSLTLSTGTIASELNDSLSKLSKSITEPTVLLMREIADNIKGISNGMIDDILRSIFERVQE